MGPVTLVFALIGLVAVAYGVRWVWKKYGPKGSVSGNPGGGGSGPSKV